MKKKKNDLHPITLKVEQLFKKFNEQQLQLLEQDEERQKILYKKMAELGIQESNYGHIKWAFVWWYGYIYAPKNWENFLNEEINLCTDAIVRNRLISLGKPFIVLGELVSCNKTTIEILPWREQKKRQFHKFFTDNDRKLTTGHLSLTIAFPYGNKAIVAHPLVNMAFTSQQAYLIIDDIYDNHDYESYQNFVIDNFFLLILVDYTQAKVILSYMEEVNHRFESDESLNKYAAIGKDFVSLALGNKLLSLNQATEAIDQFTQFLQKTKPIIRKENLYIGALLVKYGADKKIVQQLLDVSAASLSRTINKMEMM